MFGSSTVALNGMETITDDMWAQAAYDLCGDFDFAHSLPLQQYPVASYEEKMLQEQLASLLPCLDTFPMLDDQAFLAASEHPAVFPFQFATRLHFDQQPQQQQFVRSQMAMRMPQQQQPQYAQPTASSSVFDMRASSPASSSNVEEDDSSDADFSASSSASEEVVVHLDNHLPALYQYSIASSSDSSPASGSKHRVSASSKPARASRPSPKVSSSSSDTIAPKAGKSKVSKKRQLRRHVWTAKEYGLLIAAHCDKKDTSEVARSLDMPLGTAKRIIRQYVRDETYTQPKQRGGAHHRIYDISSVMQILTPWLERSGATDVSLDEMRTYLAETCQSDQIPSRTTLSKWLEGEMLVVNRAVDLSASDAAKTVPAAGARVGAWAVSAGVPVADTIFVAHCDASLWTKRNRCGGSSSPQPLSRSSSDADAGHSKTATNVSASLFVAVNVQDGCVHSSVVCCDEQASGSVGFLQDVLAQWSQRHAGRVPHVVLSQSVFELVAERPEAAALRARCNLHSVPSSACGESLNVAALVLEELKPSLRANKLRFNDAIVETNGHAWNVKTRTRSCILQQILLESTAAFSFADRVRALLV